MRNNNQAMHGINCKSAYMNISVDNLKRCIDILIPIVFILFCFCSGIAHSAEPPLNIYYIGSGPTAKVNTKWEAGAMFVEIENDKQYKFKNQRLFGWMWPEDRYGSVSRQFSFVYDLYKNGALFMADTRRYMGLAVCGGNGVNSYEPGWYIDIQEERCVCAYGKKLTITGDCVDECPDGEDERVCHGSKNNGPACVGNNPLFVGNPINVGGGNKYQVQQVWSDVWGLGLSLTYNSKDPKSGYFGRHWRSNWDKTIDEMSDGSINVYRSDGRLIKFTQVGGLWISDPDIQDKLIEIMDEAGKRVGWKYRVASNNEVETYSADGLLQSIRRLDGYELTLSYSSGEYSENGSDYYVEADGSLTAAILEKGLLLKVLDSYGREVEFKYGGSGNIAIATDVSGKDHKFAYDSTWRRLDGIVFPTSTETTVWFHYEVSDAPYILTGITDENGSRYATWTYDEEGRAISSEHSNGVDKTTLTYNADGSTTVTNPLGKQTTYHFTTIHGVRKVTQVEGHPTTSCEGANKSYQYDANGNVISKTDWNGVVTNYTYDMDRNLELSRTEAVGTPHERTITTEWHPQFRLPTKITEPNRITEYTYDAQGKQLTSKTSSVQ